jgi:hypothetical protein
MIIKFPVGSLISLTISNSKVFLKQIATPRLLLINEQNLTWLMFGEKIMLQLNVIHGEVQTGRDFV